MLGDDEGIKIMVGESLVNTSEEEAIKFIKSKLDLFEQEKASLKGKYELNEKRLHELKIILYAKFGESVYLEDN